MSFDPRVDVDLRGKDLSKIEWFKELGGRTLPLGASADFRETGMDNLPPDFIVPRHLDICGLPVRVIEGARIGGNLFANDSGVAIIADTHVTRNVQVMRSRNSAGIVTFLKSVNVGGKIYGRDSNLWAPHLEDKIVGSHRPQHTSERPLRYQM